MINNRLRNIELNTTASNSKEIEVNEIKTTNINILLNRVKTDKKNENKNKLFSIFLLLALLLFISLIALF